MLESRSWLPHGRRTGYKAPGRGRRAASGGGPAGPPAAASPGESGGDFCGVCGATTLRAKSKAAEQGRLQRAGTRGWAPTQKSFSWTGKIYSAASGQRPRKESSWTGYYEYLAAIAFRTRMFASLRTRQASPCAPKPKPTRATVVFSPPSSTAAAGATGRGPNPPAGDSERCSEDVQWTAATE